MNRELHPLKLVYVFQLSCAYMTYQMNDSDVAAKRNKKLKLLYK